jgi:hypothetical protein
MQASSNQLNKDFTSALHGIAESAAHSRASVACAQVQDEATLDTSSTRHQAAAALAGAQVSFQIAKA